MSADLTYGELEASNDALDNIPLLRGRLEEKGYLFFSEVLDREALRLIRKDILRLADEDGLIRKGTDVLEGIHSGVELPRFETSPLYKRILELDSFNAFGRSAVMNLLFSGLLDASLQEHRRRIGRLTFPQSFQNTTPVHQDYFYIRGTKETFTSWIPCGDCPRELGGLAILESSNHCGFLEHVRMSGTGGHGITEETYAPYGLRWLTCDFRLGDLLLFHSHTLHRALHNVTADRIRVSLEYRYQRKGDAIDPSSMEYHMKGYFREV